MPMRFDAPPGARSAADGAASGLDDWEEKRRSIIGLGEKSFHKTHYPVLRENGALVRLVIERTRLLEEALEFNRTILFSSPLPIGVYEAGGRCVLVNDAYARVVGADVAALQEQNFNDITTWRSSGLTAAMNAALADSAARRHELHLEVDGGRGVWFDCRIFPVRLNGKAHLLLQMIDLTDRKRLEERLRHDAFQDELTGLPNRRLLLDRLGKAMEVSRRQKSYLAVLYLDLDKFKHLNDEHGHRMGDLMLVEVARRLRLRARQSDTVARLGGDEFVVLIEGLGADRTAARRHAVRFMEELGGTLDGEYQLEGLIHPSRASMGLELYLDGDTSPEKLLNQADKAMYQAKRRRALACATPLAAD